MTRYYVYSVKSDDPNESINAFVDNPHLFALQGFNPDTMEFTGVFVEAKTSHEANEIYYNPKEKDVFVSCEEPRPTALKRQAYESRKRLNKPNGLIKRPSVDRERIAQLVDEIATSLCKLSETTSEVSRILFESVSEEEKKRYPIDVVYHMLSERYAQQFLQLKYKPKDK